MENKLFDLKYLDEISNNDTEFRLEIIDIFIAQIPEFVSNMKIYLKNGELERLSKEAHTAKSSVMVFGMEPTSEILKWIQLNAERNLTEQLGEMIQKTENDLNTVLKELKQIRNSV